jgi:DNA ligase-1
MATSLEPGSADWFCRVVNKKLRMGVSVKTVNAVFPNFIPEHNVMLAERYDKRRIKFPCYADVKLDGIRATYINGKFFTRKGLIIPGLEDLEEFMNNVPEAEYDGELTVRGKTFQEGNGLIRAGKAGIDVVFNVFACRDNPNWKKELYDSFTRDPQLEHFGLVQIVPSKLVSSHEHVDIAYADARAHGYEGLVLKVPNYKYVGKRSYSWIKVKPKQDAEFRIIGVYEGEGKYVGMCGGIEVKYNGQINHVGTGFTDAQRQEFWDNPPIGQRATIEWMEDTDDGNMRNPRFKGIRWDL